MLARSALFLSSSLHFTLFSACLLMGGAYIDSDSAVCASAAAATHGRTDGQLPLFIFGQRERQTEKCGRCCTSVPPPPPLRVFFNCGDTRGIPASSLAATCRALLGPLSLSTSSFAPSLLPSSVALSPDCRCCLSKIHNSLSSSSWRTHAISLTGTAETARGWVEGRPVPRNLFRSPLATRGRRRGGDINTFAVAPSSGGRRRINIPGVKLLLTSSSAVLTLPSFLPSSARIWK